MEYRLLGRTGLHVSSICLGTMTWGGKGSWEVIGKLDPSSAQAQLRQALDAGVNFVDTANIYHEGKSEEILGQVLHQPAVTSIIVGAKTEAQLADNLAATELKLSAEELAALHEVSELPREYPGWMLATQGRDRAPR